MLRLATSLLIGLVFGTGIIIGGMSNPAKVLNFFDLFGTWDPSLLLVMVSALVVTFIGYRLVFRRTAPLFDIRFHLPTKRDIDLPLVGGAALFGLGWGISGFCPGGAIPALGFGEPQVPLFLAALVGGILATNALRRSFAPTLNPSPRT
ncbi:DUF6691 family protein [Devosia sp. CAU 1758]